MAATLAFDDQQPTVGYNFVVGRQKADPNTKKTSREGFSLVLSDATASKATLEEKWSSVLVESVILLNLER